MAVKVAPHEYYSHYKRETLTIFVLAQILSALLAGGLALVIWIAVPVEPLLVFTISALALVVLNVVFSFVLYRVASKPLKLLAQAVAHVSHDPVITPPPHLNTAADERSGLKSMVQTVYELAVLSQPQPNKDAPAQPA